MGISVDVYEKNPKSYFGQNLKLLIKQSGLTQKEFAQKLGISQSTLSYWIVDRSKPDFDTVLFLSQYFDVSLDDLFKKELKKPYRKPISLSNSQQLNNLVMAEEAWSAYGVTGEGNINDRVKRLEVALKQVVMKIREMESD